MATKKKTATSKPAASAAKKTTVRKPKNTTKSGSTKSARVSKDASAAPQNAAATAPKAPRTARKSSNPTAPAKVPRPLLVEDDVAAKKAPEPLLPEKPVNPEAEKQIKKLASRPKHTPAVFKLPSKKATPILFTLEDVREVLKKKQPDGSPIETKSATPVARPAKTAKTPAPIAKPAPIPLPVETAPQKRTLGKASLNDILGLASPTSIARQEAEIPAKWRKYYDALVKLRKEVQQELDQHTRETLKRSPDQDGGDSNRLSSHMGDNGTDAFERDFALNLVSSEQEALAEIEAAIQRIHKGTYGICEITGQRISEERLEAVPFTRYSLQGQAEHEKNRRRKVSRTGGFLDSGDDTTFSTSDDDE